MSGVYVPGDRVWVLVDGYDWWPARVLSDDEVSEVMGARRGGCDVAVVFYRGATTEASVYELSSIADADHICYLETSSEKAVTNNADLQAALQNALSDSTANELKTAPSTMSAVGVSGTSGGSGSSKSTSHHHYGAATQQQPPRATRHGDAAAATTSVTAAAATTAVSGKRARGSDVADGDGGGDGNVAGVARPRGRRGTLHGAYKQLGHDTLCSLATRMAAATARGDVATLRALLCELDGVDVTPRELAATQIGVAVGDMLGARACRSLWPLARAMVSFWARHLPADTLAAVRRLQQDAQATHTRLTAMRTTVTGGGGSSNVNNNSSSASAYTNAAMPGSPTSAAAAAAAAGMSSPSSPLRFAASAAAAMGSGSSAIASPTTRAGSDGSGGARGTLYSTLAPSSPTMQRPSFFRTLCCLLDNPSDYTMTTTAAATTTSASSSSTTPGRVSSELVEAVARELVKGIASADERALLLSRLAEPELAFVRDHLLSRRWSVREYLAQPEEVFKTQREKAEEARRLRRRIEAEEAAKLANVNLTTLFTCPSCHANRCHYYEQQTRSADEPTTKFISCLECKHTWTQE